MRIGIDVGGTNTDAVLMEGPTVVGWVKTPTTPDVTSGITTALRNLLEQTRADTAAISGVMIGTTHFTNAVVERKRLMQTAAIRLGLPATASLPPMADWPPDLREALGHRTLQTTLRYARKTESEVAENLEEMDLNILRD